LRLIPVVVQKRKINSKIITLDGSQSLRLFLLHQETTPESAVKVVEAAHCVTVSQSSYYSLHNLTFLVILLFARIHLDPLVPKLHYIIYSPLVNKIGYLFSHIVSELRLLSVFSFQLGKS
jgi:hypothetical protein